MISLKEYAQNKGISYEAVRKQVNRYKTDLEGHIHKMGRTQYLDEDAEAFLDGKRAENPIIIMESSKDEEIEALKAENKALLIKVASIQEEMYTKVMQLQEQVNQLQGEKMALLEAKTEKRPWWRRK